MHDTPFRQLAEVTEIGIWLGTIKSTFTRSSCPSTIFCTVVPYTLYAVAPTSYTALLELTQVSMLGATCDGMGQTYSILTQARSATPTDRGSWTNTKGWVAALRHAHG